MSVSQIYKQGISGFSVLGKYVDVIFEAINYILQIIHQITFQYIDRKLYIYLTLLTFRQHALLFML